MNIAKLLFRAGMPVVLTVFLAVIAKAAESVVLPGHVPAVVASLPPEGRPEGTNILKLAIQLPLRDPDGLAALLERIYDPAAAEFHQYLTPAQFTKRFGPTAGDYAALVNFAKSNRLDVVATHDSRLLLDVRGAVSDIQRAFQVTLRTYRHPTEPRMFYAPDAEPSVEKGLPVLSIAGLSDYAELRPMSHRIDRENTGTPAFGSGPDGEYAGYDFRNAYAPGVQLTGFGQKVGLFAADGYYSSDITTYEGLTGLPNVPLQNVLVDGFNGSPGTNNDEVALDIEMAIAMAPGLSAVVVFEGPNNIATWMDILDTMAADTEIKQFSSSWSYTGNLNPNAGFDQVFQKMAAQGQTFFVASGDGDTWVNTIAVPCASPYLTTVGGTELTMNGFGTSYGFEAVWNSGYYTSFGGRSPWFANGNGYWGSGGGISTLYSIPFWQQGISMTFNQGSTTRRNVPDVAMTADHVLVVYNNGNQGGFLGTSCAAPLWAGFIALVNQQAAEYSRPPVGFLNPAIYSIGKSAIYSSCFHDVTIGGNTWPGSPGKFLATSGYDLCTGWGTPAGTALINALVGTPDSLQIQPLAGFSARGGTGGPFSAGSVSFTLTNTDTTQTGALTWSLINTSLWLNASATNGLLSPGGAATTIDFELSPAANTLVAGTYSATERIINNNSGTVQIRVFNLTVFARPTNDQCDGATAILVTNIEDGLPVISSPTTYSQSSSTAWATSAGDPPTPCAPGFANGVWYSYVPPGSGTLEIDTMGSDFDTVMTLYSVTNYLAGCGALQEIACSDDISFGNRTSQITNFVVGGEYYILVGGFAGATGNLNFHLNFTNYSGPPLIVSQPADKQTLAGGTAIFSVGAAGGFYYYWFKNGVPLGGDVLSGIYEVVNAQPSDSGSRFNCVVSNAFGTATSSNAILTVLPGALDHFVWNPIASPQTPNTPFAVTVTAKDAVNATVASFTGKVALNGSSGVITNTILNTPPPGLTGHSSSVGSQLYYSITPDRDLLVTALRYYAGIHISIWGTNFAHLLNQTITSTPGSWQEAGLTNPITLKAGSTYDIELDFGAFATLYALTNLPATFGNGTVSVSAYFPLYRNGTYPLVDLHYVTGSTSVVPVSPAVSGNFTNGVWTGQIALPSAGGAAILRADDGFGHIGLSVPFTDGGPPPSIIFQPNDQSVVATSPTFFSVLAGGGTPVFYQWRFNGVDLSDNGRITGAGTKSLNFSSTVVGDSGKYQVVVANFNSSVTSSVASLTVSKATPAVTWANPPAITVGTPLGASQLDASADVPGGFVYNPSGGTILPAGINQLSALFTPNDPTNFNTISATTEILVAGPPVLQTTTLSGNQLTLTWSTVPGRAYQPQYKTGLGDANWTNLGGPVSGPNATLSFSEAAIPGNNRFYRVVLLP